MTEPWFTSNLRLATHLALLDIWPSQIENTQGNGHLNLIYEERPPQEHIDSFLSQGAEVNRVLDAYHALRTQVQQARDLRVSQAAFRVP